MKKCANCDDLMEFVRMRDLVDGSRYPNRKRLIEFMDSRNTNYLYLCKACGKIEHSEAQGPPLKRAKRPERTVSLEFKRGLLAAPILLERESQAVPPDINTLLKMTPGKINLHEVITKIGYPIDKFSLESGILVCFKSYTPERPHKFLIDPVYHDVKFIAIHNDKHAFDLKNLSNAYGSFKFARHIEDFKFWFFEDDGVSFCTPVLFDQTVRYVQFYENRISMDRYLGLQCFFEETLTNDKFSELYD